MPCPTRLGVLTALSLAAAVGCERGDGSTKRAAPNAPLPSPPAAKALAIAPSFVNVTKQARIRFEHHPVAGTRPGDTFTMNHYVHGSGVACGDVDGDGRIDLYLMDQDGPNALYRNLGGMRFQDVTLGADVALADRVSTAGAFADLDRDGDLDLLVAGVRSGIAVLENDGSGRFSDRSKGSGLEVRKGHTTVLGLIDADGDGYLEVFAGHNVIFTEPSPVAAGRPPTGIKNSMKFAVAAEASHLYRGLGGLKFAEAPPESGVRFEEWAAGADAPNPRKMFWAGDAVVTDFEPDGRPDLVVSNMAGFDRWYRNLGGGRFEDIRDKVVTRSTFGGFGMAVTDYDGDGRLDLAVADMHSDMFLQPQLDIRSVDWTQKHRRVSAAKDPMMSRRFIFGNTLYHNTEELPWVDASAAAGVENMMPWGVIAADFDLDGDEDLFYPAGMGWPWAWTPDFYYRNQGDGTFEEALEEVGLLPPPKARQLGPEVRIRTGKKAGTSSGKAHTLASRAAAACDLDNDGDHDLVIMRWGTRAEIHENRLAPASAQRLVLRLRGTQANADAIGARVELVAGGRTYVRMVAGTGGYLSAPDRRLIFGLPTGATPTSLKVTWPFGATQEVSVAGLAMGPKEHLIIEEPSSTGGSPPP